MKNQLKTVLLLGALSAFLIGIGGALGPGLSLRPDGARGAVEPGRLPLGATRAAMSWR